MRFISDLTLIDGENSFLLKKRIALLKAIDEVGSLNLAAKLVPLSYKGAWDMIDVMNNLCPMPIVEKNTGGVGGGGTKLTQYGKNLVKTYEIIEKEHQKFLETISLVTDFDSGNLKFFRRFNMQISARNQLLGIIQKIEIEKVSATIYVKLKSGYVMTSVITVGAIENLGLKENDEVIVIIKSNSIFFSKKPEIPFICRDQKLIKNLPFKEIYYIM